MTRPHGTHVRYVQGPDHNNWPGRGCRCDPCRQANTDYERQRAARVEPAYITATPARRHVQWLSRQGVGLKTIADTAGVSHGTLSKLIYGDRTRGMPPSRRIRPHTAERILAVTPSSAANGARTPAAPTWQIVDQLLARGWTKAAIAHAIGQTGTGLQLGRRHVTRRNANAIRALLDRPVPPRRTRWGTTRPAPAPEPAPTKRAAQAAQADLEALQAELATILEARIDHNHWRRRAACIPVPKWMFFPARGDIETLERAKAVCNTCPVQTECLAAHLHEKTGIWGGKSVRERRQLRQAALGEAS